MLITTEGPHIVTMSYVNELLKSMKDLSEEVKKVREDGDRLHEELVEFLGLDQQVTKEAKLMIREETEAEIVTCCGLRILCWKNTTQKKKKKKDIGTESHIKQDRQATSRPRVSLLLLFHILFNKRQKYIAKAKKASPTDEYDIQDSHRTDDGEDNVSMSSTIFKM
nr:PREDICTED: uncharacterized protein LOC106704041 [Latimeria chalumnae]|eukprot:XP_014345688.1 PREDICTED: uncharacterized protein LOC106704041 [Latimeria chalumnae]